jgi:hypothetical protein
VEVKLRIRPGVLKEQTSNKLQIQTHLIFNQDNLIEEMQNKNPPIGSIRNQIQRNHLFKFVRKGSRKISPD